MDPRVIELYKGHLHRNMSRHDCLTCLTGSAAAAALAWRHAECFSDLDLR